jgi:hypothetical protein
MDRQQRLDKLKQIPRKYYELFRLVYYGEMHNNHLRRKWFNDDECYWQYSEYVDADKEGFPYNQLKERFPVIVNFFDANFFEVKEKIFFLDILQPFIDDYYGDAKLRLINSIHNIENETGPIHPFRLSSLNSHKKDLEIFLKIEDAYKKLFAEYRESLLPKKSKATNIEVRFLLKNKQNKEHLKSVLQSLQLRIDLFKNEEDVDIFFQILTSGAIDKSLPNIVLACKTNQFTYIIDSLKPFVKGLKYSNLERIGKIYSSSTHPTLINQSLLSNSKTEHPAQKDEIDEIFSILKK